MIHPTAIVSPHAAIGEGVKIGAFCIIHDHVTIGAGSTVGAYCELGLPTPLATTKELVIGRDAIIRSHCTFYAGSVFGDGLMTGHQATVRENTRAGLNLQIGTLNDIQGHCTIGDYVRFQSSVLIGQQSRIGNFVRIYPYVVLTNDPHPPSNIVQGPTINDYAVIATMVTVFPGVTIGEHAVVGAHSCVTRDIAAGMLAIGSPAKTIRKASEITLKDGSENVAYPWTRHFHRGFPEHIVAGWREEE